MRHTWTFLRGSTWTTKHLGVIVRNISTLYSLLVTLLSPTSFVFSTLPPNMSNSTQNRRIHISYNPTTHIAYSTRAWSYSFDSEYSHKLNAMRQKAHLVSHSLTARESESTHLTYCFSVYPVSLRHLLFTLSFLNFVSSGFQSRCA